MPSGRRPSRVFLVLALSVGLAGAGLSPAPWVRRPDAGAAAARPAAQPPGGVVDSAPGFGWTQGSFSVSDDGAAQYRRRTRHVDDRGRERTAGE